MLDKLEQKAALRILVILAEGDKTITDLRKTVKAAQDTIYRALTNLKELNLIEEVEEKTFPRRKFYRLTKKGREVSRLLKKIKEVLEYG